MNQHVEYVSPGHPDRLADAIAESIVTAAVQQRANALVGVEIAVHTDCVFVDRRLSPDRSPSISHIPKLPYERQHRILLPLLEQILRDLEAGGLEGAASTFTSDKLLLNAAGEFAIGGPEGDNGLFSDRKPSAISILLRL